MWHQETMNTRLGKMKPIRPWGSFVLVVLLAVMSIWGANNNSNKASAAAAPSAAQCKEERRLFLNACKAVIYGRLPSPACCERIRVIHLECVCSVITPKLAALIDPKRAIRLVEGCGRRVPRHFKCGSITTP